MKVRRLAAADPLVGGSEQPRAYDRIHPAGGLSRGARLSAILAILFGGLAAGSLFLPPGFDIFVLALAGAGLIVLATRWHTQHGDEASLRHLEARAERLEREIAVYRAADEAWARSEERFRTPLEQMKDYTIFLLDARGRITSWNPGVKRVLGYDRDEFIGKTVAELFTPEDRDAGGAEQELREAAERLRVSHERWLVRKDGTRFWASESIASVHDLNGRLLGYAKRLRDLSESKAVEEQLRRTQEAIELAHEAAGLGAWDHDLISGELRWDAQAKALFGLPTDATLTDTEWTAAIHPEDLAHARERWDSALQERSLFSAEFRVIWPDGSIHWIMMMGRASFDPPGGTPLRMTGVTLDLTERRRTEESLQEVLRLDAVGRLAGGIAHDLNNMLAAILGFSEFLARSLGPGDPRRNDVDQIIRAADRSASLTRELLTFARREVIQPRVLNLNDVIGHAVPMLRSILGENVSLDLRLAPGLGTVYADPVRVEQTLMNLVLNAKDAMPQGGQLTIETRTVDLQGPPGGRPPVGEAAPVGRFAMLAVTDTGHGIEPATLQRIWEPFFTTKPAGQGTGLGLSAVYGAVKQSGGFVWADSQPGQGTTMQVYWPEVGTEAEASEEAIAPLEERGGSETLMVVEDEPLVRALALRTLKSLGYRCLEAGNAAEALRLLEEAGSHVDLVITDVVMPGLSGGGLGERLALLRPHLPVLYTSGFAGDDVIRRGLLEEGQPFLQKPAPPRDLARKVREVLDAATRTT